ncbi:MarR family winged helix-turn-helix transcriptional regulator [Microbacterium pygmaeum]|uniref:DNA-binding transcriptional regulator, MarR family n=1 Tax=Microbacterium pygmaeum TaxID=370764 RepID=A0A1G7VAJ7_9MICO|nr:MarR family winged helix-turn-helix transcriptional regulator [Microbacterium pygmaeum]SDG56773.1 DNA-binding transcriptional regulator, MarR family [Microbacterium pygmaeum]
MIRHWRGVLLTGELDEPVGPVFVDAAEVVTTPLGDVVDSENFTPRLLHLISNALVWRESRLLRDAFNLGTNDWRVISAISIRPGATSTEISEFVAMNKAIVSKSVNTLIARELIVPADGRRGSRHLYLTRAGADMHDRMKPISMQGQEIVLGDLSPEEIEQLNRLLMRLLQRTPELSPGSVPTAAGVVEG